jgi:hypothetical protein
MADASDFRERLFKSRRLLLAVSVVLLAHYALGIQVASDADSLGLKFQLPDVQKVWVGVWLVWTWALMVYLQHCHEFKFDDFPRERLENARYGVIRSFDRRKLWRKYAQMKTVQGRSVGTLTSLSLDPGTERIMERKPTRFHDITTVWDDRDGNGNYTGKFVHPQALSTSAPGIAGTVWGWIYILTATRFGTDYFAPLLIAVVTFGYGIRPLLSRLVTMVIHR